MMLRNYSLLYLFMYVLYVCSFVYLYQYYLHDYLMCMAILFRPFLCDRNLYVHYGVNTLLCMHL